jgi:Cytochrome D1 heme domain
MNALTIRCGLGSLGLLWLTALSALAGDTHARPAPDPLKRIVVVEADDRHVSLIEGERFERIHRFASRATLRGEPGFTPDGRYAYFASHDGWISKFDIRNLKVVAETRAGIETRNLALSGDGSFIAVANAEPHTLVLLDADLNVLKVHRATDQDGQQTSPVSVVRTAAPRRSFIAALKDLKEVWELSYDPQAAEIPLGVVHDFQYREGAFMPGFLNPKRSFPDEPLDDLSLTPDGNEIIGASTGSGSGQVVHLDVRRRIARLELPGILNPGAALSWKWQGRDIIAMPDRSSGMLSIIDLQDWKTIRQIRIDGPAPFLRSHDYTPYVWVGTSAGSAHPDTLQLVDKQTLEVGAVLRPEPGKTPGHIQFSRDGRHALVSLLGEAGTIIVFDAQTLEMLTRITLDMPPGADAVGGDISR